MNVPQKLKLLIECNEWFNEDSSYAQLLKESIMDYHGFPKVEIDGDPSEEIRFVTSDNYNEERYEMLETETFEIVSVDDEEILICAGSERQAPLTFSLRACEDTGKLLITDVHQAYNDGWTFDEFDDLLRNI